MRSRLFFDGAGVAEHIGVGVVEDDLGDAVPVQVGHLPGVGTGADVGDGGPKLAVVEKDQVQRAGVGTGLAAEGKGDWRRWSVDSQVVHGHGGYAMGSAIDFQGIKLLGQ